MTVPAGAWQRAIGRWAFAEAPPGRAGSPDEIERLGLRWDAVAVPTTVAAALAGAGAGEERLAGLDGREFWFRTTVDAPAAGDPADHVLRFDGLATLATVWLDGERVLDARNMFRVYEIPFPARHGGACELVIRFAPLDPVLGSPHPRPRWKAPLVAQQNLRFVRTTLLGRMPGWTPAVAPVGPWRAVHLCRRPAWSPREASLGSTFDPERRRGQIEVNACFGGGDGARLCGARLVAGERNVTLSPRQGADGWRVAGSLTIDDAEPWWPHTHGEPSRTRAELIVTPSDGRERVAAHWEVGLRSVAVDAGADGKGFALLLNGERVFCRGACWTPVDFLAMGAGEAELRAALEQVRDAGMNLLRLGGPTLYESDLFYLLCDELGILVWQDFALANLDYPEADPEFASEIRAEAEDFLRRTAARACLAVLCGGSEVAQQAAMMGLPRETWLSELFTDTLPAICQARRPDLPYVPNSPLGGDLPFRTGEGVSHAFGIGAYLRPVGEAAWCEPRFATECLAFSNLPEGRTLDECLGTAAAPPAYRARVPRDRGVGWDFGDVTDHYLEALFRVDVRVLRRADLERYLELARVVPGEIMGRAIGQWRRQASACNGLLIWLLRDPCAGAGWGLIDSNGFPKASFYAVKRAFAPRGAWFVDAGLDGLRIHVANDRASPFAGTLALALHRADGVRVDDAASEVAVPARGQRVFQVDALLGHFVDPTHAYRFGPPVADVVSATLLGEQGRWLSTAHHFPGGFDARQHADPLLAVEAHADRGNARRLKISAQGTARFVRVAAPGYRPDDNYFHLAPGESREVRLLPLDDGVGRRATVKALSHPSIHTVSLSG